MLISRETFEKVNHLSIKPNSILKIKSVNEHKSEKHLNVDVPDVSETMPSLMFDFPQSRESFRGVTHKIAPLNYESKYVSEPRCNDSFFNFLHYTYVMDVPHAGIDRRPGARSTNSFSTDS